MPEASVAACSGHQSECSRGGKTTQLDLRAEFEGDAQARIEGKVGEARVCRPHGVRSGRRYERGVDLHGRCD